MPAGRYIDVSYIEHSINLQMKTTCYMREVSIKHAITVPETLPLGPSLTKKIVNIMVPLKCRIMNFDVIIHILLTSNILKS